MPVENGTRSVEKVRSAQGMPRLLVAPGVDAPGAVRVEAVAVPRGDSCTCCCAGRRDTFESPLLSLESYRVPLMLAAAAVCELGGNPGRLSTFSAIPGRMAESREGDVRIVDNANSGTNASTTLHAAEYARKITGMDEITLVVGKETGAVCEGFPADEIMAAVSGIRPARVIVVGKEYTGIEKNPGCAGIPVTHAGSLEEGASIARSMTRRGSIVLSVKCWR